MPPDITQLKQQVDLLTQKLDMFPFSSKIPYDVEAALRIRLNNPQIFSGNGAPGTKPSHLGDIYIDTTAQNVYEATGLSSSANWKLITTGGSVASVTASSPLTSSGGANPNISTSMATNKLIGRGTAGTGVMEQITLGTGLSLSGTTLNASTSSPGGSDTYVQFNDGGSFGGSSNFTFDKSAGGSFSLTLASNVGAGGAVTIAAGNVTSGNFTGGAVNITAGNGSGLNAGGAISITAGTGGASSIGGNISIYAGSGAVSGGNAGSLDLRAGSAQATNTGGQASIRGGNSKGTSIGGRVLVIGGTGGDTSGKGGNVDVLGADASAGNSDGGDVTLTGGSKAGTGHQGDVVVNINSPISTSTNGGFMVIPWCAGTPTGTPTYGSNAGTGSMIWDNTNLKLYIWNGSAWKSVTLT